MAEYTYSVSLRFTHPFRSPAEITSALQLEPSRLWSVGNPRTTPKGSPLKGVYKENYWVAPIVNGSSTDVSLAGAIASALDRLEAHKGFFQDFVGSGGRSELFIGWFFDDGNSGDVLEHELLARLADFRIDVSLDVYPEDAS